MAPEDKVLDVEAAKGGGSPLFLIIAVVAVLVAGGGGFVLAQHLFVPPVNPPTETEPEPEVVAESNEKAEEPECGFYAFGSVVANLSEERLTRYLRITLSLKIPKASLEDATKKIEVRKPELQNWLISHLSDKGLRDVTGSAGVDQTRREILAQFDRIIGHGVIVDVLFEEFNVQ